MNSKDEVSRRSFIRSAAVTGAAISIVPRHVLGRGFTPPSDMLNIACVGVGGMGRSNLINLASQNIVALCDVDWGYTDKNLSRLDTDASTFRRTSIIQMRPQRTASPLRKSIRRKQRRGSPTSFI